MQPKMMVTTTFRYKAFSGTFSLGCIFHQKADAGSPPSRANANVILEDVVKTDVPAKTKQIRGNIRRQTAPALLSVATKNVSSNGPAGDAMILEAFWSPPETNNKTIRNKKPVPKSGE